MDNVKICRRCNGTGLIREFFEIFGGKCPKCGGTGKQP